LIGQTTISPGEYAAIGAAIKKHLDLEVVDTICGATRERQEALRELCARVEAVLIAGGRESSNTRRLLEIARSLGKPCWLVESAPDLPPETAAFKTLGLSAGASTPDVLIGEIESALNRAVD
jgi:4-hydroxy-3-methylbut-2-enyl diphosphate reductase